MDIKVDFGREYTNSPSIQQKNIKTDGIDGVGLDTSKSSFEVIQNLFKGFQTSNAVDEQKAKYLSASFTILEKIDSIALTVARTYINILKYKKMLLLSKENIKNHQNILNKVKAKVEAGFSAKSDMLQVQTRYTLAKLDFLTQKSNLEDELINFHKLLGRFMKEDDFLVPKDNFLIPTDVDKAVNMALQIHPAIKVSNYDLIARKFSYEKEKSEYYPSLDIIVKAEKNSNTSAIEGDTDIYYAGISLNYNLFNGFGDEAVVAKNLALIHQENSLRDSIRREVINSVELAWSEYNLLKEKGKTLEDYISFATQVKDAYEQEFLIGKRTLLDMLNVENEYNSAKISKAENYYTLLYTKYKLMDSMGILSEKLGLTDSQYMQEIDTQLEKITLPLNLDKDKDEIVDMNDSCDQSIELLDLDQYGCQKKRSIDKNATLEIVEPIIDVKKIEPISLSIPTQIETTKKIIYFKDKTDIITQKSLKTLDNIINMMLKNINLKVKIIAYTDNLASKRYNKKISLKKATIIKNRFIERGIDISRISAYGMGEISPIASNNTQEGRAKNRRVEISIIGNKYNKQKTKNTPKASIKDIELEPLNFDVEEIESVDEYDPESVELQDIEL